VSAAWACLLHLCILHVGGHTERVLGTQAFSLFFSMILDLMDIIFNKRQHGIVCL
jgi:hypothetical protein